MEDLFNHCLLHLHHGYVASFLATGHPRFFNQLFAGVDYHALTGRFITETLNTSQYVCVNLFQKICSSWSMQIFNLLQ